MCVFFTLNRSSTRRHPAHPVSVLILHPRSVVLNGLYPETATKQQFHLVFVISRSAVLLTAVPSTAV